MHALVYMYVRMRKYWVKGLGDAFDAKLSNFYNFFVVSACCCCSLLRLLFIAIVTFIFLFAYSFFWFIGFWFGDSAVVCRRFHCALRVPYMLPMFVLHQWWCYNAYCYCVDCWCRCRKILQVVVGVVVFIK